MMRDEIDFLDADYENASVVKKSRQIRTKSSSFSAIKENFTNFRIKLLNKKLERVKEKALTESYSGVMTEKEDEKMMKRATTIARLEEKIKVLSREDVPSDYIDKRAIKIKKAMMKNISYTSGVVYSVGIENYDKVFEDTKLENEKIDVVSEEMKEAQESIAEDVRRIMAEEEEKHEEVKEEVPRYVPDAVTKAEIRAEIDKEFDKVAKEVKAQEVVVEEQPVIAEEEVQAPNINLEEIKQAIEEAFKEKVNEEPKATIGSDVVTSVIDESMDSVNIEDSKISLEDIKNEVDAAMDQLVSKNGNVDAKVDRFNSDGTRREKYTYTPMTDEEIKAAQANIEYDKYEKIYKEQNAIRFETAKFKDIFKPADGLETFNFAPKEEPVRDEVVIVPEVSEPRFTSKAFEGEIVVEHKPSVVSKPISLDEVSLLKSKVEELKEKLRESEQRKNTAVQFASRTATRAQEMKQKAITTESTYNDKVASLQLLAKTLEENCNLNDTAARAARIDAECNERFISSQMDKINRYNEAVEQVDSLLEFQEEEVSHRRRAA